MAEPLTASDLAPDTREGVPSGGHAAQPMTVGISGQVSV